MKDVLRMAVEGDEGAFVLWLLGLWLPACSGDGLWVELGLGEAGRHVLLPIVEVWLLTHGGGGTGCLCCLLPRAVTNNWVEIELGTVIWRNKEERKRMRWGGERGAALERK